MADTETAVEDTGPEPGGGKKKLIVIVGVLVLVAAGAYVGLQMFGGADAEAEDAPSEPPPDGEVLDVATLTTVVGGDANLARVGLAVVLSEGAAEDVVTAKFAVLKDAAVSELAKTDAHVLRSAEGADDLRSRLTKRARRIYPDGEVLRVLLTELVVQ